MKIQTLRTDCRLLADAYAAVMLEWADGGKDGRLLEAARRAIAASNARVHEAIQSDGPRRLWILVCRLALFLEVIQPGPYPAGMSSKISKRHDRLIVTARRAAVRGYAEGEIILQAWRGTLERLHQSGVPGDDILLLINRLWMKAEPELTGPATLEQVRPHQPGGRLWEESAR